ncbi:MAG: hypothetical protein R2715_23970 [Ilumatobacteraceae bacterium]
MLQDDLVAAPPWTSSEVMWRSKNSASSSVKPYFSNNTGYWRR